MAADAGGLALIAAVRTDEGRSDHVVMIAPEMLAFSATRDAANEVVAPVEGQAGVPDFLRGNNARNWWRDHKFADASFWLHD